MKKPDNRIIFIVNLCSKSGIWTFFTRFMPGFTDRPADARAEEIGQSLIGYGYEVVRISQVVWPGPPRLTPTVLKALIDSDGCKNGIRLADYIVKQWTYRAQEGGD